MLDSDGGETDNVNDAVVIIVPLPDGKWEAVDLRDFEKVEIQ